MCENFRNWHTFQCTNTRAYCLFYFFWFFWTIGFGHLIWKQFRSVRDCPDLSRLMTKPTKWPLHPAKTQIRPVWSESSLSARRKLGSLAIYWAPRKDTDQTGQMPRLIWVFAGRTCNFIGFVMRRLISVYVLSIFPKDPLFRLFAYFKMITVWLRNSFMSMNRYFKCVIEQSSEEKFNHYERLKWKQIKVSL